MYYTHEYSHEIFNTFEECENDLIQSIDIVEYAERIGSDEILRKFFRRKSDEEFLSWFENKLLELEEELKNDLIFEYEEEESED